MALMPAVLSAEVVVFVDAIDAGDEAGSVFKFDPDEAGLTGLRSSTSHGVGIPYLVTNARLKGHSPEFVIYAVQIGDIMCGPDTLSPQVADAVPHVEAMVAEEVERRLPAPPTL
jgi:hydrogenase maturation protease